MTSIRKEKTVKCKALWLFFSSADALYHWIGLGSLVVLLIKVLVLNDIPAPLSFMSAISPVIESILGSVIASYIFYMFCVHPPVYAEKKTSANFVNFILTRIKMSFEEHLQGIDGTLNYDSTADDFLKAFEGIDPFTKNAPLLIQVSPLMIYADWFQYFQNENARLQKEISRLMDSSLTMDKEVTYILNLINDCAWFSVIGHMMRFRGQLASNNNPFVNPDQPNSSCCISMYDLKELIRGLQPAINATAKLKA